MIAFDGLTSTKYHLLGTLDFDPLRKKATRRARVVCKKH